MTDQPPPRARARAQSGANTVNDRVLQDPLKFVTEIYRPRDATDGIRVYYQKLSHGAEDEVKVFPPAFVSMAGGTIHDIFKDATDCLVCMAQSIKNKTVNGMCTRPRPRPNGQIYYPMFFDMDIYSADLCTPDDFQFMMRDFLCPTMAHLFDDDVHRDAMSKTHFAVYYSQFPDAEHLAQQTKSKLICGMCGKGALHRSIENMEPYAECKRCGIRFACSVMDGGVDTISTMPLMFSKPHILKAHRGRMPFAQTNSLSAPEPWTRIAADNWDADAHIIEFTHGALKVKTQLKPFATHVDKTSYKYGVHVKALNGEWLAKKRRVNRRLTRNMETYLSSQKRPPKTARTGALKYLSKIKKMISKANEKDRVYMAAAEVQTRAMAQLPMLFLTEQAHGAPKHVEDLDAYVATQVDTLVFTPDTARMLCDYLTTKAIRWQEALPEDNFWKRVDMGEAFDDAVYTSGLRVPYAPKMLKCKHTRHQRRSADAPANCLRCNGSGKYPETERPPYELQMIVNALGESVPDLTEYLRRNIAGQLALTTIRMPIMGQFAGTMVRETGHLRVEMANIPRSSGSGRSGIPENQAVQAQPEGSWQAYLGTQTEIDARVVLDPLQEWIRGLRPEWENIRINQLKKVRSQARSGTLPDYWVNIDSRSEGVYNCPYNNGDHSGGTIYFRVRPPKTKSEVKALRGKLLYYCWSGGCDGNKCRMDRRKHAHLPPGVVRRIWDPTSFVSDRGSLGELGPTLSAMSKRRSMGKPVKPKDIARPKVKGGGGSKETGGGGGSKEKESGGGGGGGSKEKESGGGGGGGSTDESNDVIAVDTSTTHASGIGVNVFSNDGSDILAPQSVAAVYSAMSGDLLMSCHAQMYKALGGVCKPTDTFSNMFTAMNQ
jgi:hypothetical protein